MHRWFHIFIAALSLLVLLGGCDSENVENSAKKKEKERLEQQRRQEEAERQRIKDEEKRKKEEEERKKKEEERKKQEEEKRKKQEEEQKKEEEKRKVEEKRRQKFQSIAGIYNGVRSQEGKSTSEPFELKVQLLNDGVWYLSIVGYRSYDYLALTTEEEDKLVFYKIFAYYKIPLTVTCYYTLSSKSVRITSMGGSSTPWEFEGTRQ